MISVPYYYTCVSIRIYLHAYIYIYIYKGYITRTILSLSYDNANPHVTAIVIIVCKDILAYFNTVTLKKLMATTVTETETENSPRS